MRNSERKTPRRAANDLTVLLRTVLGEDRFPVDVEALALEISRNHEDPIVAIKGVDIDGFEGMLRAHRKKPGWQILYNTQTRYRGRERFTLAHEFGHYLLHRCPLTAQHYRDGELPAGFDFECHPLQADEWQDAEKEREEEADTFASYLLMPMDDYRVQVNGEEMSRTLLAHVTDRYGVSLLAAVRKWIEFTRHAGGDGRGAGRICALGTSEQSGLSNWHLYTFWNADSGEVDRRTGTLDTQCRHRSSNRTSGRRVDVQPRIRIGTRTYDLFRSTWNFRFALAF